MPHADVNGQRIYYEDTGGGGLPLVLAHGLLMDHEMFTPQVEALAPPHRVVTWDERSHGLTETTPEDSATGTAPTTCAACWTRSGSSEPWSVA